MIPVLTIDGPSGVGKGTVAKIVAAKLKWHILDSGAIYRAFALAASKRNIEIENTAVSYTHLTLPTNREV